MKVRSWFERHLNSSPFFKHVLTLLSGTVIAQAIVLIIELILARVYSPEQTGRFALFMSVASIVIVLASGRFDMTIMLPKADTEALVIRRLATRLIIAVSLLGSAGALIGYPWVLSHYKGDSELALLMIFLGITVFLVADLAVLQYWLNRKSNYKAIALNRVQQSVGSALGKLLFGLSGMTSVMGIFLGQTLGQLMAWLNLRRKTPELREPLPVDAPPMKQMAIRYKKMPLLNGPTALIEAIRTNGINMLIAASALGSLGQFDKAWVLLQAPIALINGAIGQVFFQKLATVEPGRMRSLVSFVLKRSALIGVFPFLALYFTAPSLFPFLLGEKWAESGTFAQALVPWLFMVLLTSPISQIFVVTETQQWFLLFSCFYGALPIALLYFSPWPLHATIHLMGFLMAGMLVIMLALAYYVAGRFDASKMLSDGE